MRAPSVLSSLSTEGAHILLNELGRTHQTWFENGYTRWNVWRGYDELRVLEERLRSIAYADPFDVKES